jgi:regulator of protease activity HflC (stomatin/prohibitin superfamily)
MRNSYEERKSLFKLDKKKITALILGALAIVCLCCVSRVGEDVKNEEIVVNQYPFSGNMEYWTTPGWKWQWFGRTTSYYKTQQFWFGGKDAEGVRHGNPIMVIFNDASVGYIHGSLRVELPADTQHLSKIQTAYTGMERLMNELVAPNVGKVIYASGPLMSAFESYAEKKNDMIAYITDQLTNGIYKTTVSEQVTFDALTGEEKKVKIASLIEDPESMGGYKRSENSPFTAYGVKLDQVSISEITYDEKVNQQIATQQQANMSIQTKKAEAAAAQQDAIKAEAEGKAAAAKAKWEQERIKATEVTKAEQEREVARLAAEKAEFDKKRIVAEGEAEAAKNRALVAAGLTPLERAQIEKETRIGVAEALSKTKWPTVVMGGNSGGNTAMDVIALKQMTDLVNKMSE